MRCKQCDYPLWNLRDRKCPECGLPFRPSEFRFAVNAVRFACPHCDQGYYGTGADGHLVPRVFSCVGCGNRIDMDEMVLLPTEGVDERLTKADANPWLDEETKLFSRWLTTLSRGAGSPGWLMRVTPLDADAGPAWGFAVLTHMLVGMAIVLPALLLAIIISLAGAPLGAGMAGFVIGSTLVTGAVSIIWLALWVLTTHAVVRAGGRPAGGIGRTAHALCYTCAPQTVVLVPCLGPYLGWVGTLWWIVVGGIAVATAQKVSGLRAALAVLVLPLLTLLAGVAWIALMVGGLGAVRFDPGEEVSVFNAPLRSAADSGAWPRHAGEFLLDGTLSPYDFVSSMSETGVSDAGFGSVSLWEWDSLSPQQRESAVSTAAAAVPGPYRVGDFVFTYPGLDPASRDPDLWIVIEAWDPAIPGQSQYLVHALTASGAVRSFPLTQMASELQTQNALRAAAGLPTLPDPFSVLSPPPAPPADPG